MSLRFLLWLLAGILMAVASIVSSPRISLATMAWAMFILGWATGEVEVG